MDRITERKTLGFWGKLKRLALTDVGALVRRLNASDVEAMERLLLEADFGLPATADLVDAIEAEIRSGAVRTEDDLRQAVEDRLAGLLESGPDPGRLARAGSGPTVMLFVGVNGVGKTTTVAKVAHRLRQEGRSVLLAAADTWRAGAIDQLRIWAERLGAEFVAGTPGGDPAAVAFDALEAAAARGVDDVLVDTAGRLHTQEGLMAELQKLVRVMGRKLEGAPHETLLVLDANTGQNAISQARIFTEAAGVTGLVLSKMDGTAKGGVLIGLADEFGIPVRFVGVGEGLDDLRDFDAEEFVEALFAEGEGEA